MNKYILGGVGILIVVATVILVKTEKPAPTVETPAVTTTSSPTVTYTNDGFSPAELTVKAGSTVTFVNQSDAKMWVASANHPSHLLYPEFNEKASVAKGSSYSFTFNKLGTHPYHNHVLLGKYGKIIVE